MYRNVESLRGLHRTRSVPNLQSPLCKHHILLLWDWELSHARRSFPHCAMGILAEIPYLQLLNLDVQRVLVWLWSRSHAVWCPRMHGGDSKHEKAQHHSWHHEALGYALNLWSWQQNTASEVTLKKCSRSDVNDIISDLHFHPSR